MRKSVLRILLFVCIAAPMPAFGGVKHRKAAPVVAKFGGECRGVSFRPSPRLRRLIEKAKRETSDPGKWPCCADAFTYDLDGDGSKESFVRLSCGATGNCTWGVFSDHPARSRGAFVAWFFYIHRRSGSWSALTAYIRQGGKDGAVTTFANRRGMYVLTSERADEGYYQNSHPFLKRVGVPRCEFSGAAQPNNGMHPTPLHAASHAR
jgi:hypothetical protein